MINNNNNYNENCLNSRRMNAKNSFLSKFLVHEDEK